MTTRTRLVYLSPMEASHAVRFMKRSGDPELVRTMGWSPFQEDEMDRFLKTIESPSVPFSGSVQPLTFSILAASNDLPIGYVTLKALGSNLAEAELGIAIFESKYRSGGYGSEALELSIDYAFAVLQVSVIWLTVFPTNARAIRVYEKLGFQVVDVLKEAWTTVSGEQVDLLLMERRKEAGSVL